MNKVSRTCKELVIGIFLTGVVMQIPVLAAAGLHNVKLSFLSVGLWTGIVLAAVMALHMDRALARALLLDAAHARRYQTGQYILRVCYMLAVFALLCFSGRGSVPAAFVGTLSLKFSAYCNPLIHKFTDKRKVQKGDNS